jgi:hypothetical protein
VYAIQTTNEKMSDKEKRATILQEELEIIIKAAEDYCLGFLEEEFEPQAIEAIRQAAQELAYTRKYYDVRNDEIIFFPTVARLVMTNVLSDRAESYYYEEEDEFPPEYSKALKTVCRDKGLINDEDSIENDEYREKLAQDVDLS